MKIAKLVNAKEFIAKSKSPSCGCGLTYDGTFSGKLIKGDGVTVALLKKNKIRIINEKEYQKNKFSSQPAKIIRRRKFSNK